MMTDTNIIEGPWEKEGSMTDEEYNSAMEQLLNEVETDRLGHIVAGVLEFLTVRALMDGPYYILTENKDAITVLATNDHVQELLDVLPDSYKNFEDTQDEDYLTDSDPGDEQDESTA